MSSTLKAIVKGGRAIIEDVDYPDGTELVISVVDDDEMSEESRARLHAAIRQSIEECDGGTAISADVVLAEMRAQLP